MRSVPQSVTLTTTPQKIADIEAIGIKISVHCKTGSANSAYVYLTEDKPNPGAVVAADYTHEIVPGGLYETPMEHIGEVWAASSSGSSNITISKYG